MDDSPGEADAAALARHARALGQALGRFDGRGDDAGDLIALVGALEDLKCRAEGAQAMASAAFDAAQRAEQAAIGVPVERQGQGVGLQVALARRESHHRGQRHLGLARTLVGELPCTLKALRGGRISEWRATLVARETACLSREHRAEVDQRLGDADDLHTWGERELVGELRRMAYRLDAESVLARRRRAESERTVSLRPAPDTMTYLTALLPVAEGVGAYAALTRAADAARAEGDERSRGQVMADLMVARLLGQPDGPRPQIPVTVNVVVSDQVLMGAGGTGSTGDGVTGGWAEIFGYGPVPASLARDLATAPTGVGVEIRRLYARPAEGGLVAMDSRARCFPAGLAELIRLRDRTCRTPWCDAPIRHTDHVRPAADAGPTTLANGQGLCEACNHAKQASGWTQHVVDGQRHEVVTTTPARQSYRSTAPPGPRPADVTAHRPDRGGLTSLELALEWWLHAA